APRWRRGHGRPAVRQTPVPGHRPPRIPVAPAPSPEDLLPMITIALDNNRPRASGKKHGIIKVDSMALRFYPEAKHCGGRTDPQAGPAGPPGASAAPRTRARKSKKEQEERDVAMPKAVGIDLGTTN